MSLSLSGLSFPVVRSCLVHRWTEVTVTAAETAETSMIEWVPASQHFSTNRLVLVPLSDFPKIPVNLEVPTTGLPVRFVEQAAIESG